MPISFGMDAHAPSHAVVRPVEDRPRSGSRLRERGFTMIELVVSFVLIGIVLAMAAGAIIRGFSGAAETSSSANARAKAAEAAERIGADVRGARSVGRDGAKIADVADLVRAVRTNGPLYDIDGNLLDWRDITAAQPNVITFQADVVDEAPGASSQPECVTWSVANATGGWYVRRVARAYVDRCGGVPGGGGTVREDDALTSPTPATVRPVPGTRGVPALFSYVVAQRAGGRCRAVVLNRQLSADERNRITGVRLDFSSIAVHRNDASHAALRDEISIRSRSAADYQLALGCDEG